MYAATLTIPRIRSSIASAGPFDLRDGRDDDVVGRLGEGLQADAGDRAHQVRARGAFRICCRVLWIPAGPFSGPAPSMWSLSTNVWDVSWSIAASRYPPRAGRMWSCTCWSYEFATERGSIDGSVDFCQAGRNSARVTRRSTTSTHVGVGHALPERLLGVTLQPVGLLRAAPGLVRTGSAKRRIGGYVELSIDRRLLSRAQDARGVDVGGVPVGQLVSGRGQMRICLLMVSESRRSRTRRSGTPGRSRCRLSPSSRRAAAPARRNEDRRCREPESPPFSAAYRCAHQFTVVISRRLSRISRITSRPCRGPYSSETWSDNIAFGGFEFRVHLIHHELPRLPTCLRLEGVDLAEC